MAADSLVMPKLGLTMQEGTLAEWRVTPGQRFRAGDILFVVETDKIANEVEAGEAGELADILVAAGETVPVGTPVARLLGGASASAALPPQESVATSAAAPPPPVAAPPVAAPPAPNGGSRLIATPLARRTARERGVDLRSVAGSGPGGRIKQKDVLAQAATSVPPQVPVPAAPVAGRPVPLAGAQATVARRLAAAKRDIPHFYLSREADLRALEDLRRRTDATGTWGKTTLTAWLITAIGRALAEMPEVDRVWTDDGILALESADVGIAIDGERGLHAPLVRGAGGMSVGAIAARLAELTEAARAGGLVAADIGGGAITLSNLGMHGVTALTPIINPGQAMILGTGAARPVFRPDEAGRPSLRHELTLVLAADHRVLNGVSAARFLGRVVARLEDPLALLLQPLPPAPGDAAAQARKVR